MAAVIGEFVPGLSRFHTATIASPSLQHRPQHPQQHSSPAAADDDDARSLYRPTSRNRDSSGLPEERPETTAPPAHDTATAAPTDRTRLSGASSSPAKSPSAWRDSAAAHIGAGPSRVPSTPSSSSPSAASPERIAVEHGKSTSMAIRTRDPVPVGHPPSSSLTVTGAPPPSPPPRQQQPSPSSDDFPPSSPSSSYLAAERTATPQAPQPAIVHVRDIAHVQSLAKSHRLDGNGSGSVADEQPITYEISAMPISDIIEMVAALLTKITTTNDLQHDAMSRNATHQQQASQSGDSGGSAHMSPLSHSVLAFHGKNVPAITILSYLSRIHKYCPTTYEVFLSLLVYFDRMTERVNELVAKSEEARRRAAAHFGPASEPHQPPPPPVDTAMGGDDETATALDESDSDLADDSDDDMMEPPGSAGVERRSKVITVPCDQHTLEGPSTYFVVDSFNIHRLIIAGITCASKFFSDVFYTNSRYAKVGGLPLAELNHLEIQFLVLNEFRLAVPVEDLEAYATMLVEFYAREVVAHKSDAAPDE